jgi:CxxC motif-containing protein (DUF1111 family)
MLRRGITTLGSVLLSFVLFTGLVHAQNDPGFDRLSQPLDGLTNEQLAAFLEGKEVFEREFDDTDGLGPLSNSDSCVSCHRRAFNGSRFVDKDGGSFFIRARQATAWDEVTKTCDHLKDLGGPGFQADASAAVHAILDPILPSIVPYLHPDFAASGLAEPVPAVSIHGVPVGPIDDRTTNDLFGLGLIDAVRDHTIEALADPDDLNGDGISGRVHWAVDHRGETHVGKFGRKAEIAHLDEFNAEAFQNEQGVTNPEVTSDGIFIVGADPNGYDTMSLEGLDGVPNPEVSAEELEAVNMYVRLLAPAIQNKGALSGREYGQGRSLFSRVGCADCHTPSMRTGPNKIKALSNKEIQPFSDFLLHDMGPDLAEGCKGDARPQEWRTEPLWALRFINPAVGYMHDGRAGTIEEAILAHGGEGAGARAAFEALSNDDKSLLLNFLDIL